MIDKYQYPWDAKISHKCVSGRVKSRQRKGQNSSEYLTEEKVHVPGNTRKGLGLGATMRSLPAPWWWTNRESWWHLEPAQTWGRDTLARCSGGVVITHSQNSRPYDLQCINSHFLVSRHFYSWKLTHKASIPAFTPIWELCSFVWTKEKNGKQPGAVGRGLLQYPLHGQRTEHQWLL